MTCQHKRTMIIDDDGNLRQLLVCQECEAPIPIREETVVEAAARLDRAGLLELVKIQTKLITDLKRENEYLGQAAEGLIGSELR